MKILYRRSFQEIVLVVFSLFILSACSDWTEMESIDLEEPGIAGQNPELYANYLENLREYKNSDHKTVYVWFDNSLKVPFSRSHHITDLPDSIDVISMIYPDNLAEWELKEIEKVRSEKATKVIYSIDFESIKAAYNAKLEVASEEEPVSEDFIGFLTDSLEHALSLVRKYDYDGICIGYTGKLRLHMYPDELREYTENETMFINVVNDWYARNPEKMIIYEGQPQNLIDPSLLDHCQSVLLSGKAATNQDQFSYLLSLATVEGIPHDRFGVIVMAPDLNDPNQKTGYFTDGTLAISGLAGWAPKIHAGIGIQAVGIYNVSSDYHISPQNYYYTRQLISSINPSIK